MTDLPVLYSFRRCPYAMRARMALWIAGITCELREVKLADKPPELLATSEKATVPVLLLPGGEVIDESIDIMRWALAQNDPEGWLAGDDKAMIERNDGSFKHHLDRYKYPDRYDSDAAGHRAAGYEILRDLDLRLSSLANLHDEHRRLADMAIFPFVRQFVNTDRAWFNVQPIPRLQGWLERHLASDVFAAIMLKYSPWKAGDAPVQLTPH